MTLLAQSTSVVPDIEWSLLSPLLVIAIGGLTSVGLYLITARSLSRVILGFSLLGHASVLALLTAGGPPGKAPTAGQADVSDLANPIPQALALTAIVISFGLTLFLLALAGRQQSLSGDDLVEADLEDKRIGDEADAQSHRGAAADSETESMVFAATGNSASAHDRSA